MQSRRVSYACTDPHWHEGVVGIIASRMKEQYGLPTIVFAKGQDGLLKGSGRSVPGLHLRDALVEVALGRPDLLPRYGGHAMAVGLSLAEENLKDFQARLAQVVMKSMDAIEASQVIKTDGELGSEEMTLENAEFATRGHPWGQGFVAPLFEGDI